MPEPTTLHVTQSASVVTITMARPEVHNAFNEQLIAELHEAFINAGRDPAVRVVVLAGEGKSFSAGADLDWMKRMAAASEEANRLDGWRLARMLRSVAECSKPVIACVHGAALGGGAGLVAAADIAIVAESAVIGFSEVRLGLIPATIAPHVVDKIGPGRALPLFLTAERLTAQRAYEIGLVYRVAPGDDLAAAVSDITAMLLEGGPAAQAQCKKLVRRVSELQRQDADWYTAGLISTVRASTEGREGVSAFLDKRKPSWRE